MEAPLVARFATSPAQTRIEPMAAEIEASVARIEALSRVMDSAFAIPGTNVRLGLDAIIGLVPVLGDLVSQAISSYIIWEARKLGVSRFTMARMIGNTALDTLVGIIPFAGDAFDVLFRANMKNLALLKRHLEKKGYSGAPRVIEAEYRRI